MAMSIAGLALGMAGGCAAKVEPREDATTMDLRHIARAYGVILYGHPPRSLDEIKGVLDEFFQAEMSGPPEEVLVSERDGEPYVIVLGVNLGAVKSGDIFIYEKKGKDGMRYAMKVTQDVVQMSDAEFAQATFANGHKPEK